MLGVSRSELYRRALSNYIGRYDEQALIAAINAVCESEPEATRPDPVLERIQSLSMPKDQW